MVQQFTTFVEIDGCPVPIEIAHHVRKVGLKSGATLQSCYRGSLANAPAILRKNGKSTQKQLWDQSQLPGSTIRANPPGKSTHEGFNDGVAYKGAPGMRLAPWQVGQDWQISKVDEVVKEYRKAGIEATVTYPSSVFEKQHVNIRKKPKTAVIFRSLKRGQASIRVRSIRSNLATVLDPQSKKTYLPSAKRRDGGSALFFDETVYHALREFQRDHGLKDTGIYDYRTAQQLAASVRFAKNRSK